jgi:hypothetical protein
MAERGTIQKIADAAGVDHQTVRNALKASGREVLSVGLEEGVSIVQAVADPARIVGHQLTRVSTNPGLTDARTRHEGLKARKLELETAKLEGQLIDREAVTATGAHIIATARTALLSLGYRLAEKVANKSDVREIARIVEAEVRDVLGGLTDESAFFAALEADALS